MIKRIFQDIDECILYTDVIGGAVASTLWHKFKLHGDSSTYHTIFRPCAKRIFDFYRSIVGEDNVYILTTATQDYAEELNIAGGFGLNADHIISRKVIKKYEKMKHHPRPTRHPLFDADNVLIDNLQYGYNLEKVNLMGISLPNYLCTGEYYGDDESDDEFEVLVKQFIGSKYEL